MSGGEHLLINAEEKEEEQKEQVPIRNIDKINLALSNTDIALMPHSPVINYHPFRRPVCVEPSETEYETLG